MLAITIITANLLLLIIAKKAVIQYKKNLNQKKLFLAINPLDTRSNKAIARERLKTVLLKDKTETKIIDLNKYRQDLKEIDSLLDTDFKQRCFSTRNIIKNMVEIVGMNYQLGKGISKK